MHVCILVVFASRLVSLFGILILGITEMMHEGRDFAAGRVWEDGWMQERMHDQSIEIDRSDMKRDAELV